MFNIKDGGLLYCVHCKKETWHKIDRMDNTAICQICLKERFPHKVTTTDGTLIENLFYNRAGDSTEYY